MNPFDGSKRILLVGDVFVDYHLANSLVRLGGVFHSARALDAIGVTYAVAYVTPSYLEKNVEKYLAVLNASASCCIGSTSGAPNVILIGDSEESGPQGYDDLLREERQTDFDETKLGAFVERFSPTDMLIFPGTADFVNAAYDNNGGAARLHIDIQYDLGDNTAGVQMPVETIFVSTSSPVFQESCNGDARLLRGLFEKAHTLILKENRGGSRVSQSNHDQWEESASYPVPTQHSVGVGDCFDAAWIAQVGEGSARARLARCAWYASLYASTWDHEEFKRDVQVAIDNDTSVIDLLGVRLSWEDRQDKKIYLAAPDFPNIDVAILDRLEQALKYHNFTVLRPVKLNGLYDGSQNKSEVLEMFNADIALVENSDLLIAVPLVCDPGTFAELGVAAGKAIPTILYDPLFTTKNLFAENLATTTHSSLHEVIDSVFQLLGEEGANAR